MPSDVAFHTYSDKMPDGDIQWTIKCLDPNSSVDITVAIIKKIGELSTQGCRNFLVESRLSDACQHLILSEYPKYSISFSMPKEPIPPFIPEHDSFPQHMEWAMEQLSGHSELFSSRLVECMTLKSGLEGISFDGLYSLSANIELRCQRNQEEDSPRMNALQCVAFIFGGIAEKAEYTDYSSWQPIYTTNGWDGNSVQDLPCTMSRRYEEIKMTISFGYGGEKSRRDIVRKIKENAIKMPGYIDTPDNRFSDCGIFWFYGQVEKKESKK